MTGIFTYVLDTVETALVFGPITWLVVKFFKPDFVKRFDAPPEELAQRTAEWLAERADARPALKRSLDLLFDPDEKPLRRVSRALRAGCAEGSVLAIAALAGLLAGGRHAHLREAWTADLYGDPEAGSLPSARSRLELTAGFVIAALRCRLDDAADLAWRPVDALLSSWHGSRLAAYMPITVALCLVLSHEGFYGLITNTENLGVIAAAPYAAIKVLRKYRQIATPKRPEKKTSSADSSKR
jgi:hypothetical protein